MTQDEKDFNRRLGANIARLRKIRGLKQKHFAHALGVTHESISHMETGDRRISVYRLRKVADLLNVFVTELIP